MDSADLARDRFSRGRDHNPNRPMASPAAQVQIHHRTPARRLSRMSSRTTSATAHPAVMTPVTSWSFALSGGGGDRRAPGSRICFTLVGYEIAPRGTAGPPPAVIRTGWLHTVRNRDVLSPRSRRPDEGSGK